MRRRNGRRAGRQTGWLGLLAAVGVAMALVLAPAASAQEGDDEVSACESSCFDQEQACYDSCEDLACEEACADGAERCLDSCD